MNESQNIYLDNNATTALDPEVLEAMLPYYKGIFGNPSSLHAHGQEARRGLDQARTTVAALINAEPEEIIFTSGATEANNLAILGHQQALLPQKCHLLTSTIEHHAVLNPAAYLGHSNQAEISYAVVDHNGIINMEQYKSALQNHITLVSIMAANNDVGTIQPLSEMVVAAADQKTIFHSDAVQAVGKIPLDVKQLAIDMLSFSAHKIYGPKGVGALYVKRGIQLAPTVFGGHQENNRRAGTENLAAIVGFAKACELAGIRLATAAVAIEDLKLRFEKGLLQLGGVTVNGSAGPRLAGTSNVTFTGIEGETLLMALDLRGISIATGSACNSSTGTPSHVLRAMGIPAPQARSTVRFSIGRTNTVEDIDKTLQTLISIVPQLRR